MKSNFDFLKKYDDSIYSMTLSLEKSINTKKYDFSKETRILLERIINKANPQISNTHNLGEKINLTFNIDRDTLLKKYNAKDFYEMKNQFIKTNNKVKGYQHDNPALPPLDHNDKIEILYSVHTITRLLSANTLEKFNFGVYSDEMRNLFSNELEPIFQEYLEEKDLSEKECFVSFVLEQIIEDFYNYTNTYEESLTMGDKDGGLEAFYFNETDDVLNILNANYTNNYSSSDFRINIYKILDSLKVIFVTKNFKNYFNSSLSSKIESINESFMPEKINIFLPSIIYDKNILNDLKKIKKEFSRELNTKIEVLLFNQEDLFNMYNFNNIQTNLEGTKIELELANKDSVLELQTKENRILLTSIKAQSLVSLYLKTSGQILAKNLRGYVKNKKIDDDIVSTARNKPEDFIILNNGITAIAEINDEGYHSGDLLKFKNFYIINGGQTTKKLSEIKEKIPKVNLFAKIIIVNNKDIENKIINEISVASNQQKAIKPEDLWSNKTKILEFKKTFNETFNDFYFMNKRDQDEKNKYKKNKNIINLQDFLQIIYATVFLRPDLARNNPKKLFSKDKDIHIILKKMNLKESQNKSFLYDLLYLNNMILKYKKTWKVTDEKNNYVFARYQIVKNGSLFLLMMVFALYFGSNLNKTELEKISLLTDPDEYLKEIQNLSLNFGFDRIINRGKANDYQEDEYIPDTFSTNLEDLLIKITTLIYDKWNSKIDSWANFFKLKTTTINLSKIIFKLLSEDDEYLKNNLLYKCFQKIISN